MESIIDCCSSDADALPTLARAQRHQRRTRALATYWSYLAPDRIVIAIVAAASSIAVAIAIHASIIKPFNGLLMPTVCDDLYDLILVDLIIYVVWKTTCGSSACCMIDGWMLFLIIKLTLIIRIKRISEL